MQTTTATLTTNGLRERKKAETRAALSQAALLLALERGPANVTADDIAAAANVSVRTFHNYFGSKEEAIVAAWKSEFQEYLDELRGRPADEPILDSLEGVFSTIATSLARHPERMAAHTDLLWTSFAMVQYRSVLLDEAVRMAVEIVAERTHTDPETDVYPHLVTAAAMSAMVTAFQFMPRGEAYAPGVGQAVPDDDAVGAPDRVRLIHDCFALLRAGLGRPGASLT